MSAFVTITKHTTASKPEPHVRYIVELVLKGRRTILERRFSEFLSLHESLNDEFDLPPKRLVCTALFPSGWVDDDLIAERKRGLSKYLSALLWSPEYRKHPVLLDFLHSRSRNRDHPTNDSRDGRGLNSGIDIEDVLPSTFSRKDALALAMKEVMQSQGGRLCAGYYPEWCAAEMPPEKMDFSKFDMLFFGFVTPNAASQIDWGEETQSVLKRLVRSASKSDSETRILLSIGGWEGSQWFSHVVSTAVNRMTFVGTIVSVVSELGLHGIDIDWEFPNWKGAGNPYSPNDAANLLKLIRALRAALGPSKIISASVGHTPWLGSDGLPLSDVSAFADELSFLNVMNYSVFSSSTPGSNAPLGTVTVAPTQPQIPTAAVALGQWTIAGFPASKMLLGLPLFGYVFKSSKSSLNSSYISSPSTSAATDVASEADDDCMASKLLASFKGAHFQVIPKPKGLTKLTPSTVDVEEVTITGPPDGEDGIDLADWRGQRISFKDLVKSGALVKKFDGNYGHGDGFTMAWDDASSTPYLFNTEKRTLVTFDNTRSLAAKAKFAQAHGMAGCFTWSLEQDDGYALQNVIRSALGKF